MKTCTACNVSKPLDAFGWRYKGVKKPYQEARCKSCRAKANTLINRRAKEAREMQTYEETQPPCEMCFKKLSCVAECASFKTWEEYGV